MKYFHCQFQRSCFFKHLRGPCFLFITLINDKFEAKPHTNQNSASWQHSNKQISVRITDIDETLVEHVRNRFKININDTLNVVLIVSNIIILSTSTGGGGNAPPPPPLMVYYYFFWGGGGGSKIPPSPSCSTTPGFTPVTIAQQIETLPSRSIKPCNKYDLHALLEYTNTESGSWYINRLQIQVHVGVFIRAWPIHVYTWSMP